MAKKVEKGTTLSGRFRLDELIGGGGMGSVYAAFDLEQGHRVAVKLLNPRLARATEFRERFLDESKLAASIPHPHILTVYDHGEDEGWHYIAMRLVEDDLAAIVERDGRLELTRALNIADQVAWALDVAHEQGLLHRDVKPENVLVTPRRSLDEPDHAYLCDFGIAKLEAADRALTRTGAFIGTVSYASPEQARGDRLDGRSDQYSLACVLYEMLTGTPPFSAPTSDDLIEAHCSAERPRLSAQEPELPDGLDPIVARGMAIDREERFETCRELVTRARAAAREALAAAPVPPPAPAGAPPTVVERRTAPPSTAETARAGGPAGRGGPASGGGRLRRNPIAAGLLGLAALVMVGIVLAAVLTGGDDPDQVSSPDPTTQPSPAPDPGEPEPGPGPDPGPDQDPDEAEEEIRGVVEAYAAAEGEQEVCATVSSEEFGSCEDDYADAQPTEYDIQRVEIADDEATVQVTQSEFGDPMEFSMLRQNDEWLIVDFEGFTWKSAESVEAVTTVVRFGRRDEDACKLLSREISDQCKRLLPSEPLSYDVTNVSISSTGTGSISAQVDATDTDSYSVVRELGQWRISEIN